MGRRSYHVTFDTSVYIENEDINKLPEKLNCLKCILEVSDIEVMVDIDAQIHPGCEGSWESPPEPADASLYGFSVQSYKFHSESDLCEDNIKFLMTKEQKDALVEFTGVLIEDRWDSYEEQAFDSYY